jgi:hypothetical protein
LQEKLQQVNTTPKKTAQLQLIASERDAQLFFNAIICPKKPSKPLKKALKEYTAFCATQRSN